MSDIGERYDSDGILEQELRAALHPLPAPDGFTNRVIERSRELPRTRKLSFTVRRKGFHPALRWSIAAMLLLAIVFGGVMEHQRQRRIAGERAAHQVMLALRITSFTLQTVRNRVDKNSAN